MEKLTKLAALLLMLAAAFALANAGPASANSKTGHRKKPKGAVVSVMTRNLYLGADLGPALAAKSTDDFINKNGQILRDVDTNNFPERAKGLAQEIIGKSPDLVGLQEAALWRTGPVNLAAPTTGIYTASTVKYDYLKLLMNQLNKGKKRYRVVRVQNEFDFEAPADYNGIAGDGTIPGVNSNGEIDGRLTMRDAILAKVGAGIRTVSARGSNYAHLYMPTISGIPVTVNRGWVGAAVKVRKSRWFNFVDTHLESFDDGTIRENQAKELVDANGPLRQRNPGILVGDLNSDDNTVSGGDTLAYDALEKAGLRDRSTEKPLGCCVDSSILTKGHGKTSDFTEHIDHVMTDRPRKVLEISSSVTGRKPVNGYWDSDHAGMYSKLRILP